MNTKDAKLWINALRSGKYKQTRNTLQDGDGYCCLGVACKVFIPKDKQSFNLEDYLFGLEPGTQSHAPKWLQNINNDFDNKTDRTLSQLNDGNESIGCDQYTFDEIADLLQAVYVEGALDS